MFSMNDWLQRLFLISNTSLQPILTYSKNTVIKVKTIVYFQHLQFSMITLIATLAMFRSSQRKLFNNNIKKKYRRKISISVIFTFFFLVIFFLQKEKFQLGCYQSRDRSGMWQKWFIVRSSHYLRTSNLLMVTHAISDRNRSVSNKAKEILLGKEIIAIGGGEKLLLLLFNFIYLFCC